MKVCRQYLLCPLYVAVDHSPFSGSRVINFGQIISRIAWQIELIAPPTVYYHSLQNLMIRSSYIYNTFFAGEQDQLGDLLTRILDDSGKVPSLPDIRGSDVDLERLDRHVLIEDMATCVRQLTQQYSAGSFLGI